MPAPSENGRPAVPAMEVEQETRRAVRLVGACALAAVVLYLLLGALVRPDALFTRAGLEKNLRYTLARADALDRRARWGDRPVVWVVGSSITRATVDASLLHTLLARGGWDAGVEKMAFDRGAPLFSWMMLDHLDIRPGDVVLTTVAYDNFRAGWLEHHGGFRMYLQVLGSPRHLFRIRSLHPVDRLEYALASVPPRDFWRYRDAFRNGVDKWVRTWFGGRVVVRARPRVERFAARIRDPGRPMPPGERNPFRRDELRIAPGQVNHDGLRWWREEVRARGATPVILHVPHHPGYAERFTEPGLIEDFHAQMASAFPEMRCLPQLPAEDFLDWKHPDFDGQVILTRRIAAILLGED